MPLPVIGIIGALFKPGIIKTIIKNWKFFAVLVLVISVYWHWDSLIDTRDKYTQLLVSVEQIKQDTDDQNKAIADLKLMSDNQAKELKKALERANDIQIKYDSAIAELINQKPPKECSDVVNWMIDTKGDLAWPDN
jgi:hypothetical protein